MFTACKLEVQSPLKKVAECSQEIHHDVGLAGLVVAAVDSQLAQVSDVAGAGIAGAITLDQVQTFADSTQRQHIGVLAVLY